MSRGKRTRLLRRQSDKRDARLFIIAAEGKRTEKRYFSMFGSSRVTVVVLPASEDDRSAPEYVLERLNTFSKQYNLNKDDQLWLVLDVDRWGAKKLKQVCQEAKQNGYHLAVSKPCFEVWLWLHLADLEPEVRTCRDFEKALKEQLEGYNKSNLDASVFKEIVEDAIARAKELHPNPQHYWPPTIGSHVYRVAETILQSLNN